MTTILPINVQNVIYEYYSQLNDFKWTIFINPMNSRIEHKLNIYSSELDIIDELLFRVSYHGSFREMHESDMKIIKNMEFMILNS